MLASYSAFSVCLLPLFCILTNHTRKLASPCDCTGCQGNCWLSGNCDSSITLAACCSYTLVEWGSGQGHSTNNAVIGNVCWWEKTLTLQFQFYWNVHTYCYYCYDYFERRCGETLSLMWRSLAVVNKSPLWSFLWDEANASWSVV